MKGLAILVFARPDQERKSVFCGAEVIHHVQQGLCRPFKAIVWLRVPTIEERGLLAPRLRLFPDGEEFAAVPHDELYRALDREFSLEDLAYRLARHIRNTDKKSAGQWGVEAVDLLTELRERDPKKYDAEVKASREGGASE